MLHDGHTVDTHFAQIGIDLSKTASFYFPLATINSYRAKLDNDTVHLLVRYDPGVKLVLHDGVSGKFGSNDFTSPNDTNSSEEDASEQAFRRALDANYQTYVPWGQSVGTPENYWRKHFHIVHDLCLPFPGSRLVVW